MRGNAERNDSNCGLNIFQFAESTVTLHNSTERLINASRKSSSLFNTDFHLLSMSLVSSRRANKYPMPLIWSFAQPDSLNWARNRWLTNLCPPGTKADSSPAFSSRTICLMRSRLSSFAPKRTSFRMFNNSADCGIVALPRRNSFATLSLDPNVVVVTVVP